jgi:hypothetical protein
VWCDLRAGGKPRQPAAFVLGYGAVMDREHMGGLSAIKHKTVFILVAWLRFLPQMHRNMGFGGPRP